MVSELINTVKVQLYERVSSPLLSAFMLSWCIWNYRFFLVILDKSKVENKLILIDSVLYPTWTSYIGFNFVGPLCMALIMIYLYPIPARWVFMHTRKKQLELKVIQQLIEDETPMTLEESRAIRQGALKLEIEFHSQLKKKDEEITDLKDIVSQLNAAMEINARLPQVSTNLDDKVTDAIRQDLVEVNVEHALPEGVKGDFPQQDQHEDHTADEHKQSQHNSTRTLLFGDFWKLDDATINEEASALIADVTEGRINNAIEILTLMQRLFFLSTEGILSISTPKLKAMFEDVLNKKYAAGELKFGTYSLETHNIDLDNEDFNAVKETLYNYQKRLYQETLSQVRRKAFLSLKNHPEHFFATVEKYQARAFLDSCDVGLLVQALEEATPDTVLKVSEFIQQRYRPVNIAQYLEREIVPLRKLTSEVEALLTDNEFKGTRRYAFKALLQTLRTGIDRLSLPSQPKSRTLLGLSTEEPSGELCEPSVE